jgi:hypothetical protein
MGVDQVGLVIERVMHDGADYFRFPKEGRVTGSLAVSDYLDRDEKFTELVTG